MLEALHAGHNQYMPVVLDDFTTFLQYKLAEIFMKNPAKDDCIRALCGYADITPELAGFEGKKPSVYVFPCLPLSDAHCIKY